MREIGDMRRGHVHFAGLELTGEGVELPTSTFRPNYILIKIWTPTDKYNESGLPSHTLIHLVSDSYQQPTYWAPPSFYPNLETYAPTYLCTLSHDGIIIMPGYHRVGFPGKSYYGTAQNQEIIYQHKTTILIP